MCAPAQSWGAARHEEGEAAVMPGDLLGPSGAEQSGAHLLPFLLGRMKLFLPQSPHTRCPFPTEIPLVLWGLSELCDEQAPRCRQAGRLPGAGRPSQ